MDPKIKPIFTAILEGDRETSSQKVQDALDAGVGPDEILNKGMIDAMSEVGRLFEEGEYFVPEMLISARAMQACLAILKPYLVDAGVEPIATVVIGTVQGDLHDIGKNLVAMMLEGAGFKVVDLGVNVTADSFIEAVQEHKPALVALSALLTTTMPQMKTTIEAFKATIESGAGPKILVGGAPVTDAYAHSIGADGYAPNASKAAALAKSLLV